MRPPPSLLVLPLAIAALAAPPARATVNIEKYRMALEEDGAAGNASLAISSKTGNVDLFETTLGGTAGFRSGRHLLLGVVAGTYSAKRTGADRQESPEGTLLDSDARYANKLLGALRYNLGLSERLAGELFTQVQYDEFLRMDLRSLGGLGVRVEVLDGALGNVHVGTGAMLEYERQDPDLVAEDPTTLATRWTSYVCFALQPVENLTLSSTSYAQPRLGEFSDYRLLNESALSVSLGQHLSVGIAFTLRHDSDPARLVDTEPPLVATDTELTNKLTLEF